jgi:hypothetical protein
MLDTLSPVKCHFMDKPSGIAKQTTARNWATKGSKQASTRSCKG